MKTQCNNGCVCVFSFITFFLTLIHIAPPSLTVAWFNTTVEAVGSHGNVPICREREGRRGGGCGYEILQSALSQCRPVIGGLGWIVCSETWPGSRADGLSHLMGSVGGVTWNPLQKMTPLISALPSCSFRPLSQSWMPWAHTREYWLSLMRLVWLWVLSSIYWHTFSPQSI